MTFLQLGKSVENRSILTVHIRMKLAWRWLVADVALHALHSWAHVKPPVSVGRS